MSACSYQKDDANPHAGDVATFVFVFSGFVPLVSSKLKAHCNAINKKKCIKRKMGASRHLKCLLFPHEPLG